MTTIPTPTVENIENLRPHPRNYRKHPDDQLAHLMRSIEANGVYRNIVCAQDGTILAGHGVVQACTKMGLTQVPVIRMPFGPEDARALKLLAGDNEIGHLGEIDDRALTELLREVKESDVDGLLGTGYDEKMLAGLLFVTRPAAEVRTLDEAAEWVGMPSYENAPPDETARMTISFPSAAERERFCETFGIVVRKKEATAWNTRWPWTPDDDLRNVRVKSTGKKPPQGENGGEQ